MKKVSLHIFLFLLLPSMAIAQRIDNSATFRDIKSDNYFRFHYDNDYFTATDFYYTQGYNFELVSPIFKKNPLNSLFLQPKNSEKKYGLSIEHMGFTPTSISSSEILMGDRPFAAAIMIKSFLIATDTVNKTRLVSGLSIGIIGPAAFGNEMQTGIHKWIGDEIPDGWQYQIKNDLLLNYELSHEKQILRFRNFLALHTNAKMQLGTVNTSLSGGITTTFGIINNAFSPLKNKNKFQIYGYFQPTVALIGYDASLQGGLFNNKSPYVINANAIDRFTFQNNFGIIMQYKALYLEYSRVALSREFETGKAHKWGGFRIGFKL